MDSFVAHVAFVGDSTDGDKFLVIVVLYLLLLPYFILCFSFIEYWPLLIQAYF